MSYFSLQTWRLRVTPRVQGYTHPGAKQFWTHAYAQPEGTPGRKTRLREVRQATGSQRQDGALLIDAVPNTDP